MKNSQPSAHHNHRDGWHWVFKRLTLVSWLLVLTGVIACAAGGYTLVSAIHHGGNYFYPILYFAAGVAFMKLSNTVTAMAAEKRGELAAKEQA